jgi:hypothetical protein
VVTIVTARYGGIYEPGKWLAFPCWPDAMPEEWNADDTTCIEFWRVRRHEVGGGTHRTMPSPTSDGSRPNAADRTAAMCRYSGCW